MEDENVPGDDVSGNSTWLKLTNGIFVWSGGTILASKDSEQKKDPFEVLSDISSQKPHQKKPNSSLKKDLKEEPPTLEFSNNQDGLQWWHEQYGIPEIWDQGYKGQNVTVVIFDSGINNKLECFKNSNLKEVNITGISENDDTDGHGTKVSSVVCADSEKHMGIAPRCNLIMYKIRENIDSNEKQSANHLLEAINHLINSGEQYDVLSISQSFFKKDVPKELKTAIEQASKKAIVVASAGNWGRSFENNLYPASFPNVISVGCSKRDATVSPNSCKSRYLNILAPGHMVHVISNKGEMPLESGTSFSTPFVASVIALGLSCLFERKESYVPQKIIEQLLSTATKIPGIHKSIQGQGIINPTNFFTKILTPKNDS